MPRSSSHISSTKAPISWQEALFAAPHRFSFNGKENDSEVKGEGNQQDYGMRIYDPRISKFLSVDPLTKEYPWYTPYQFAGNMPIKYIDLDGLEPTAPEEVQDQFKIVTVNDVRYYLEKYNPSKILFNFNVDGTSSEIMFWLFTEDATSILNSANLFSAENISGMFNRDLAVESEGSIDPLTEKIDILKIVRKQDEVSASATGKKFRHYSSQAYLAARFGQEKAKEFGDFYERNKGVNEDSDFDLINNQRGREIGVELAKIYDLTTSSGVAGFLNAIVDITRKEQGLDPLGENERVFNSEDDLVKELVIPNTND